MKCLPVLVALLWVSCSTPHLTCNARGGFIFLRFSSKHNSSLSNERFRQSKLANLPPQAMKHLWIRTALMEKLLDKIVLYLVENSRYSTALNVSHSATHYRALRHDTTSFPAMVGKEEVA